MAEMGPISERRFSAGPRQAPERELRRERRREDRALRREVRLNRQAAAHQSTLLRATVGAAASVIVFWGLAQAEHLFITLALAALLALLLSPLLKRLHALHAPDPLAITLCILALLLPFGSVGYLILREVQSLAADFPRVVQSAQHTIEHIMHGPLLGRFFTNPDDTRALVQKATGEGGQAVGFALSALGTVLGMGSQTAEVLLFTVLFLAARFNLRRTAEKLLAKAKSIEPGCLLDELVNLLQQFLYARFLIVLIVGAIDTGALFMGGVRYAALLGASLGVATLIPAIGFIIALTPVVIVMAGQDFSLGHMMLVVAPLIIMSIIEGNVLTPKMVGRRLNINTLATFLGLFVGGLLWGVWGMFLSIPIMGALRIMLSVFPALDDWGALLAEREDRGLALRLRRRRPLSN